MCVSSFIHMMIIKGTKMENHFTHLGNALLSTAYAKKLFTYLLQQLTNYVNKFTINSQSPSRIKLKHNTKNAPLARTK